MIYFLNIFWWGFFGLIVYLIWFKKTKPQREQDISPLTLIFALILAIVVASFLNFIWEDITNAVLRAQLQAPTNNYYSPYYSSSNLEPNQKFKLIAYHTLFTIPIIILAVALYFKLYKKGAQYSAMIMPYLIGSIFIVIRLLFDIGDYLVERYERVGMYLILIVLMVVFSGIVFFVQKKWQEGKREKQAHQE